MYFVNFLLYVFHFHFLHLCGVIKVDVVINNAVKKNRAIDEFAVFAVRISFEHHCSLHHKIKGIERFLICGQIFSISSRVIRAF